MASYCFSRIVDWNELWGCSFHGSLPVSSLGNVTQAAMCACRLTYGADVKANPTGGFRIQRISQVYENRLAQVLLELGQVDLSDGVPFRHDDDGIRISCTFVRIFAEVDTVEDLRCILDAGGVICPDACTQALQGFDERHGGRIAHVVGIGPEGQAENGDGPAVNIAAECLGDLTCRCTAGASGREATIRPL